jgi:hypothetical protein
VVSFSFLKWRNLRVDMDTQRGWSSFLIALNNRRVEEIKLSL